MVSNREVWVEFIKTATQIFSKIGAEDSAPIIGPDHVNQDLKEFKELGEHIADAGKIVEEMVGEDKAALDKAE
jgi:hypothetical protein